ncbi:MAG: anthranilate synthase component I, partial [Limnobacter sp.]|nr:anthranilate synthase component I [Limnobacter sp.]
MMTRAQYDDLVRQGYNRIPLVAECYADLDTPLSIYLKLANSRNTFLLESVVGGERSGRYSFIGLPSDTVIEVIERQSRVLQGSAGVEQEVESHQGDPLAFIESFHARFKVPTIPDMPRFFGGLAGYFGYDSVRYMEPKLEASRKADDLGTPDILLMLTDRMAVVDNIKGTIQLVVFVDPDTADAYSQGCAELDALMQKLQTPAKAPACQPTPETEIDRSMS